MRSLVYLFAVVMTFVGLDRFSSIERQLDPIILISAIIILGIALLAYMLPGKYRANANGLKIAFVRLLGGTSLFFAVSKLSGVFIVSRALGIVLPKGDVFNIAVYAILGFLFLLLALAIKAKSD